MRKLDFQSKLATSIYLISSILFAVGYGLKWLLFEGGLPELFPDSQGYIDYEPHRTPGYPLFLRLILMLCGSLKAVAWAQLAVASISVAILARDLGKSSRNFAWGFVLLTLYWINPGFDNYHFAILTESLFGSILCLYLATVVRLSISCSAVDAFWLALMAGAAYQVRPTGIALILASLVLIPVVCGAHAWQRIWRPLGAFLVVTGSLAVAAGHFHRAYHGENAASIFGLSAFSRGVMVAQRIPEELDNELAERIKKIQEIVDPVLQDARLEGANFESNLLNRYTIFVQFGLRKRDPGMKLRLDELAKKSGRRVDQVMGKVGVSLIRENLAEFLKQTRAHFLRMWFMTVPLHWPSHKDFLAKHSPLPLIDEKGEKFPATHPSAKWSDEVKYCVRYVLTGFVFLLSLVLIFASATVRRINKAGAIWPLFSLGLAASVTTHLAFLATALTNVAHIRYHRGFWPALACLYTIAVAAGAQGFRIRHGLFAASESGTESDDQ